MSRSPGGRHVACAERGFTLLEVLMALVLLALLLGLAWGSMRTAIQASRAGEALIARTEQARTVHAFLRRQLSQAMPVAFERLEDNGVEMRFDADADGLRFVAPMPGYLSRGGAHVQTLTLVGSGRGRRLEFNHEQLNGYDPLDPSPERDPVVLIEGIRDGRFEFRDLDESGQLGDWTRDWDMVERLPLMVRLVLEFDRDDPRRWPDFEVTLVSAASGIQPVGFTQRRPRGLTIPGPSRPRGGSR